MPSEPSPAARRPRLTPAVADTRRAVREALADLPAGSLALVALSGGPDSLALAAATGFEAPRLGLRAGAVIVDHGLQPDSGAVAERAAVAARALGLDPIQIERVMVGISAGPEAAARHARYARLEREAARLGAAAVLLGHSLDDQAETVLLGLARGSGTLSIAGMAAVAGLYRRPLLGIRRATLAQACVDQGLEPWSDPHNSDERFARVRVRRRILPMLEEHLDAGIVEALARTAAIAREDAEALDHMVDEVAEELTDLADGGCSLTVAGLLANPPAIRHRLIRLVMRSQFGVAISRAQTLEVARLVTDWHGQGPVHLPGVRVERTAGRIVFVLALENEHIVGDDDSDEHLPDRP
ncbi:tRNA lysidine(34) synthetase TilS [Microcella frigidaquae]|uniref:tRNA(Ile)-lysidine synthase n=1 Tax=Microcella frigidaquae TaxID=424758 RepID=A0A840XN07_9MICO|nr:tRNA lysidine(34) synthetase TilS [Microcella frigidaquae]MBB5618217.1 tRNA(Ile)-lysidine synthase [Microcella frigidaquae]NHN44448.1 tRNA lysidine(34) synthetase TilS [Microcella frigidaquae]